MVSLVIPIYNEKETIPILHDAVVSAMDTIGEPWEVVYVNDGSTDSSLDLLLQRQQADPRVAVVELSRNWGHNAALSAGLQVARGDAVVLLDGDMQDPPAVVPDMVEAWRAGAQVVIAQRRSRHEKGLRRHLFPLFYKVLGLLSDFPIPLNAGIFGLLDREAVDAINRLQEGNRYLPGLRAWVGFRNAVVWYDRPDRARGTTKYSYAKLLQYALNAIFSFSYKPLRLATSLGVGITAFALVYGVFLLTFSLNRLNEPGLSATLFFVLLLGGVQLLTVGILGEYIGRIYDEVRRRPLFIIHRVNASPSATVLDAEASLRAA